MTLKQAFEPTEPYDAMAEYFRKKVANAALEAMSLKEYRALDPADQISVVIAGVLTGLYGVSFAACSEDGRDAIDEAIKDALEFCREQAVSIIENGTQLS